MDEFNLIEKYFTLVSRRDDVLHGVGDDAAILKPESDKELVMSMDTLISGVHFPVDTSAYDIACKAVAVNLSDIAAMGAEPSWLMLSLSLPETDTRWLQSFADGFSHMCERYHVDLVGGDTTRGPLSISVHASGMVEAGTALRRDAAQAGDYIYVSGHLGDAALALQQLDTAQPLEACLARLNRPVPRVALGQSLRQVCRCAIDISDGLLADLGHILDASACGAEIDVSAIPLSKAFAGWYKGQRDAAALQLALSGGDDYELCFTVDGSCRQQVEALAAELDTKISCIGRVKSTSGVLLKGADEDTLQALKNRHKGFMHFGYA